MRKFLVLASLVPALAACGRDHDDVAADMVSALEDLNKTLDGIQSADDLKKAQPKIKEIADKMKALKEEDEKLGKVTESKDKELKDKYGKRLEEATGKLMANAIRLAGVEGAEDALKPLQNIK